MKNKPVIYYAQWPGVKDEDLIMEVNQLGRLDYKYDKTKIFTKHQGWDVLEKFIELKREDILEATNFRTSDNKKFTLEKLFDSLNQVEFRK